VSDEFMRFMAAWALVHESADEGWKAAVDRGAGTTPEDMAEGPDAFVDGLAAAIAEEKERLKAALAEGGVGGLLLRRTGRACFAGHVPQDCKGGIHEAL
jgi:hypothetical protein